MILNMTGREATPAQLSDGVVELPPKDFYELRELLSFDDMPDMYKVSDRAEKIANIAHKNAAKAAMVSGPLYMIAMIEACLIRRGIQPCYAFSHVDKIEVVKLSGEVRYVPGLERHVGFVWI